MTTLRPVTSGTAEVIEKVRQARLREAVDANTDYPQYAGYWDGWPLVEIVERVVTKGGVRFEAGDLVLTDPATRHEEYPRCYSYRGRINVAVPARLVRDLTVRDDEPMQSAPNPRFWAHGPIEAHDFPDNLAGVDGWFEVIDEVAGGSVAFVANETMAALLVAGLRTKHGVK